jgi:hypothetical protein
LKKLSNILLLFAVAIVPVRSLCAQGNATAYLGFDRNAYPGDGNLTTLHQTFSYAGYWLNNPPGEKANSWAGHRAAVQSAGFGFLVLFNGRLYAELKSVSNATRLGRSDAALATAAAKREGFLPDAIIFLDQEQGGRMLPEQKAYIFAWVDGVAAAGFRAGVYCSGTAATDDGNVVTAEDIRTNAGTRNIVYWIINDGCPPAPGCFLALPLNPRQSGIAFAEVWQFAQSPQRKDVAAHCTNYSRDGNCYAPGIAAALRMHVDLNTATSPDPSHGRTQ